MSIFVIDKSTNYFLQFIDHVKKTKLLNLKCHEMKESRQVFIFQKLKLANV